MYLCSRKDNCIIMFWIILILFIIIAGGLYCFKQKGCSTETENFDVPVNQDNQPMPKPRTPLPWKYGDVLVVGVGSAARKVLSHLIDDDSTHYPILFIGNSEEEIEGVPFCNVSLLLDDIEREGKVPSRYETNIRESLSTIIGADDMIDRVLIVLGLGGQTGTSLSPVVANIARDLGKYCYVLTTTPFRFEGKIIQSNALDGIRNLSQNVSGFYCLNLACTGKDSIHSYDIVNTWMKELIGCIAYKTRGVKGSNVTNKHINVPFVVDINNSEDWLESVKAITSEPFASKTGIDLKNVPVLDVYFVLGKTHISVQTAHEMMDQLQQWCNDEIFMEVNLIFNENNGTSKLILMAERVECNYFLESVQSLYEPTEEELKRKEFYAKVRKLICNAHRKVESVLRPSDCDICPHCDIEANRLTGKIFTFYDDKGNPVLKRIRGFCHKCLINVERDIIMDDSSITN